MRRGYITAGLRSEISEYSSLLRALQSNNALDISPDVTTARSSLAPSSSQGSQATSDSGASANQPDPGPRRNSKRKRSARSKGPLTRNVRRETSSRWPLLVDDVCVPEWGLEEEMKLLASQSLKRLQPDAGLRAHHNLGPSTEGEDEDEDEDDILSESFVDALTTASSSHLSQIFSLLAAHVPLSENSMQGRIMPISWESVLDIVSVSGACDPKSIANVQRRMEAIYGPSTGRGQCRMLPPRYSDLSCCFQCPLS